MLISAHCCGAMKSQILSLSLSLSPPPPPGLLDSLSKLVQQEVTICGWQDIIIQVLTPRIYLFFFFPPPPPKKTHTHPNNNTPAPVPPVLPPVFMFDVWDLLIEVLCYSCNQRAILLIGYSEINKGWEMTEKVVGQWTFALFLLLQKWLMLGGQARQQWASRQRRPLIRRGECAQAGFTAGVDALTSTASGGTLIRSIEVVADGENTRTQFTGLHIQFTGMHSYTIHRQSHTHTHACTH